MTDVVNKEEAGAAADTTRTRGHRKVREGVVVSDKMEKTIVVQTVRMVRHPVYKKYVRQRVKYKAHDERNEARTGDTVLIEECRPMSREKRWRLQSIKTRAVVV
ncbi:MAG: 30S ribosomal protein S17 [Bradymonadia bacterium]